MEEERRKTRVALEEKAVSELRAHMENEDQQKERAKRWHAGKEVPIAVIMAILLQTMGVVWGAATLSTRVDFVEKSQTAEQASQAAEDKRQDDEARRTQDRLFTQLDQINQKLDRVIESRERR